MRHWAKCTAFLWVRWCGRAGVLKPCNCSIVEAESRKRKNPGRVSSVKPEVSSHMNKVTEAPRNAEAEADLLRAIGRNIRRLRNNKSMTLQALGAKVDLSPSMLSLLEHGKAGPSIGTLVALASALGVQMSELLE